ncbi:VWA domain-containing protein [Halorientalis marina]|uniref:VWA domain-containing protein n=1 Tax=Halorientalis marina TaxID=2931976 RepID=UPI001FF175D5|nr:VWA domain-containing protein [Halorientalis marina]
MVDFGSGKKLSPLGFDEVVGQHELKEALLAVGANDALSGLLVRGEKGTAKSTAVRALVECLPDQRAVADCPYGCPPDEPDSQCADCRDREDPPVERRPVPLVTLPLGATRDRVVGTLSVEDALDGTKEFEPGLLARANRGILYVDEVNLLDDHLVDVLLDAAASGVNRVERDGLSVTHPADVTLVGTMNPEEGDLRPQLRDRFALQATVTGCDDIEDRVAIIDRALGTDGSPGEAGSDDEGSELDAAARLAAARKTLPDVELPAEFKREIAELCREAGVDGHRADIAAARVARTFAALDGRPTVIEGDVRRAAELALPHRMQSDPFEDAPDADEVVDDHFDDEGEDDDTEGDDAEAADGPDENDAPDGDVDDEPGGEDEQGDGETGADDASDEDAESGNGEDSNESGSGTGPEPQPASADGDGRGSDGSDEGADSEGEGGDGSGDGSDGESDEQETGTPLVPGAAREGIGDGVAPSVDGVDPGDATGNGQRASAGASVDGTGARVRTERASADDDVDAVASMRAAATRGSDAVGSRDLRKSVRTDSAGTLVVFAVDASASMRPAIRAVRGVAIDLLRDAYEHRDEVAVVTFAGEGAEVVLPPTDSVTLATRHLKDLPTGDRTPLPAGLSTAADVLDRADPDAAVVVVVTDGRANSGTDSPTADTRAAARRLARLDAHTVVVDTDPDDSRTSLTADIAATTDGQHVPLDALTPERVDRALGGARDS